MKDVIGFIIICCTMYLSGYFQGRYCSKDFKIDEDI